MSIEHFTAYTSTTMGGKGMQVLCEARGMSMILDEPEAFGGTDVGMNPVEALLSSLGACKCIVAKAFAESQGINLKSVRVEISGSIDTDGYSGANPDAKVGFADIHEKFYIEADNTEEEVERFVKFMSEHCPVQDTLINPARFTHELILN